MERLQSHIWLTATSYMVKYLRISSYIRNPFLIFDFATAPFWIFLYMRKILFSFLSVCCLALELRAHSFWVRVAQSQTGYKENVQDQDVHARKQIHSLHHVHDNQSHSQMKSKNPIFAIHPFHSHWFGTRSPKSHQGDFGVPVAERAHRLIGSNTIYSYQLSALSLTLSFLCVAGRAFLSQLTGEGWEGFQIRRQ